MKILTGSDIPLWLMESLGLPKNVISLKISIEDALSPITIECKFHPEGNPIVDDEFVEQIKQYQLVEKE